MVSPMSNGKPFGQRYGRILSNRIKSRANLAKQPYRRCCVDEIAAPARFH